MVCEGAPVKFTRLEDVLTDETGMSIIIASKTEQLIGQEGAK